MKRTIKSTVFCSSIALLGGCVSFSEEQRPDYRGADEVRSIQADQIVGAWSVTALNPFEVSGLKQSTVVDYKADGTVIAYTTIDDVERSSFGPIELELTGRWSLELDHVTHKDVVLKSRRDDEASALISALINNQKGISGAANIYEISENRMVMVGDDGAAMEYKRLIICKDPDYSCNPGKN